MTDAQPRSALVTGAGTGIGRAVALRLAAGGMDVIALDIDSVALRALEAEAPQDGRITGFSCDVGKSGSVAQAFERVRDHVDSLDAVANVAGVVRYGRIDEMTEAEWDFVVDTNLKGVFLVSRAALPLLREGRDPAIVNVASVQAISSQPLVAAYSASKGGIVSLTKAMAIDHAGEGIRVNAVLPGSVRTPMLRMGAELFAPDDPEGKMQEWGEAHPLGRLAEPDDIAEVIVFLLAPQSRVMTGAVVAADEGLLARLSV